MSAIQNLQSVTTAKQHSRIHLAAAQSASHAGWDAICGITVPTFRVRQDQRQNKDCVKCLKVAGY